jgi:hypothetical protein
LTAILSVKTSSPGNQARLEGSMSRDTTVTISGIWLRKIGDKIQVLAESKGKHGRHWFLVIEENIDGAFSHIAEPPGILDAQIDPLEDEHGH